MTMTSTQISKIVDALNKMEERKEVDISIVKDLEELTASFEKSEQRWLESLDTKLSFYFYYAARNAILIISRMMERFLKAKEKQDNPVVAEDSLEIVGILGEILDLTQEGKADQYVAEFVINRTRQLREIAASTGLLQSEEKELEGI